MKAELRGPSGSYDPGAVTHRSGADPEWDRGLIQLAPTYTSRDPAGSSNANDLAALLRYPMIHEQSSGFSPSGRDLLAGKAATMTSTSDIRPVKAEARRAAHDRRALAWTAWQRRGPSAAAERLAAHWNPILDEARATTGMSGKTPLAASAYLPMRTEIDPLALLNALAETGSTTALPVVAARGAPLVFRAWTPGDATVPAGFGTREPPPDQPVVEPTLLLVPLLAYDARGYRLGYGGGYYDRTLRLLRDHGPVCAIGVAFDEQMIDAVPYLDYDERLNAVVTPSGLQRFGA